MSLRAKRLLAFYGGIVLLCGGLEAVQSYAGDLSAGAVFLVYMLLVCVWTGILWTAPQEDDP